MILKRNLVHINRSWKYKLSRNSLLSPKTRYWSSDSSYRHSNLLIANNLISFNKIRSLSLIIDPSHFISLSSHASSSSRNQENFHHLVIDFNFLLITVPLNQLNSPSRATHIPEILRLIKTFIPPVPVIRHPRLKSWSQVVIKRIVKTWWECFSNTVNVIKLLIHSFSTPDLKEINALDLDNFSAVEFEYGFLVDFGDGDQIVVGVNMHDSHVPVDLTAFCFFGSGVWG